MVILKPGVLYNVLIPSGVRRDHGSCAVQLALRYIMYWYVSEK